MTRQLKIAFDAKSTLRQNLHDGQFTVLVEYAAPTSEQPLRMGLSQGVEVARYVEADKRLAGMLVAQDRHARQTHPVPEVVGELRKHCHKELIACLAGKAATEAGIREQLASLHSAGVVTVVACTGMALPDHPRDGDHPLTHPDGYIDSPRLVHFIRRDNPDLFLGATVNPFKYNAADSYLQYYKMVKKLRTGAGFLVTQAGWDMRKFQELQWFLRSRDLDEAVLARLMILRPREVGEVLESKLPGLVISREFASLLQRESAVNEVQSLTAQIERIGLQAAGCRLLGYSGVVLSGLPDAQTARLVIDRVFAALGEYASYEQWTAAWNDFHAHVEMAPYPHRYYIYRNLLDRTMPDWHPKHARRSDETLPAPDIWNRFACRVAEKLALHQGDDAVRNLLRALLCGHVKGRQWRLDKTEWLCAGACPKGLEEGACGGSLPDGTCEFGHQPCFWHQVLGRALWRRQVDPFEAPYEDS